MKHKEWLPRFPKGQDPWLKSRDKPSSQNAWLSRRMSWGRRTKEQIEEGGHLERWLVSYADFITLLFTFFVTMYSISRVDAQKLANAVVSLQEAFSSVKNQFEKLEPGGHPPGQTPVNTFPVSTPKAEPKSSEREFFDSLAQKIQKDIEHLPGETGKSISFKGNQIRYLINENGLIIRIPERLFFNSGKATIRPEIMAILDVFARSLGEIQNHIRIEGHTDNVPINTSQFPSNWELSTGRANTIIRYFLFQHHFDPQRISAVGYAEFRPIASNSDPEGRQQNRRVDVVVLSEKYTENIPDDH